MFVWSLAGGMLVGLAAALALAFDGRIAGVSGIVGQLVFGGDARGFRAAFTLGLCASGVFAAVIAPRAVGGAVAPLPVIAIAGGLVGWGTRVGNGCTSGHGVCGVGRMSVRSVVAVVTFMTTAAITVAIVRVLGGWS